MLDGRATSLLFNSGELTASRLTEIYLAAIDRLNPELNCYLYVDHAGAAAAALAADDRRRRGRVLGPLDGIPVAIKANVAVAGWPHSAGLGWRAHEIATGDARVISRLRAAGVVLLGLTNMDEAALGASTNNAHFGACHNPLRRGFTAGGSSGGSACTVRAGLATMALGSDTMGSVRIPASYCGVVGLKPTFGALPLRGVVPLCARLDHLGFLGRHSSDLQILLNRITQVPDRNQPLPARLGILRFADRVDLGPEVAAGFEQALSGARTAGYQLFELDGGDYDPVLIRRASFLLAERALFEWMKTQGRTPDELSPGLARMVAYGARQAQAKLDQASQQLDDAVSQAMGWLDDCDVIVSPTTPQQAFPLEGAVPDSQADFTVIANLTGWPALSLPVTRTGDGLPVGLQLMAARGQDHWLVRAAETLGSSQPLALPSHG
jgi:aspartyl-tRNA(Asn)/glutamyl-tRNA(Gln) amidotransferase subunit A